MLEHFCSVVYVSGLIFHGIFIQKKTRSDNFKNVNYVRTGNENPTSVHVGWKWGFQVSLFYFSILQRKWLIKLQRGHSTTYSVRLSSIILNSLAHGFSGILST